MAADEAVTIHEDHNTKSSHTTAMTKEKMHLPGNLQSPYSPSTFFLQKWAFSRFCPARLSSICKGCDKKWSKGSFVLTGQGGDDDDGFFFLQEGSN